MDGGRLHVIVFTQYLCASMELNYYSLAYQCGADKGWRGQRQPYQIHVESSCLPVWLCIWTKETAAVSQLGCDDGNISVFLGQSSVLMLKTLLTADDTNELDQGSSLLFNQWWKGSGTEKKL